MKKLISLVLILCMACMLIPALAEDSLIGTWYLKEASANGQSVPLDLLGVNASCSFRDDGSFEMTFFYGEESESTTGTWVLDGETVSMTADDQTLPAKFSDGVFSMEMEGAIMAFSQEAPAATPSEADVSSNIIAAESEEAFFGNWKLTSVEVMGMVVPVDMVSSIIGMDMQITMTIEAGKATMAATINDETNDKTFDTVLKDGKLALAEADEAIAVSLTESGDLAFELPIGETPLKVILSPVAAAEEPAA